MQTIRTIMKAKLVQLCLGQPASNLDFANLLEHVNDPDDEIADESIQDDVDLEQEAAPDDVDDLDNAAEIDPKILLDDRVKTLMQNLSQPGDEFNRQTVAEQSEEEDEAIFGDDDDT